MQPLAAGDGTVGSSTRIWSLTAVLAAVAFGVYMSALADVSAREPRAAFPLWVFVLAVIASESVATYLRRRAGRALDPTAFVVVLGLLFLQPAEAIVVGTAAVAAARFRESLGRIVLSAVGFLLQATVAAAVFYTAIVPAAPFSGPSIVAIITGLLLASFRGVGVAYIGARLSDQRGLDVPRTFEEAMRSQALAELGAALGYGSVGVLAAYMMETRPGLVALPALLAVVMVAAGWAYAVERHRRRAFEVVYGTARAVLRTSQTEAALTTLLTQARTMFGCDVAEIVLVPPDATGTPVRTTVGPGDHIELMRPVQLPPDGPVGVVIAEARGLSAHWRRARAGDARR